MTILGTVQSDSRRGVHHTITMDAAGALACSCEAFTYRRRQDYECKHLERFRASVTPPPPPLALQQRPIHCAHCRAIFQATWAESTFCSRRCERAEAQGIAA